MICTARRLKPTRRVANGAAVRAAASAIGMDEPAENVGDERHAYAPSVGSVSRESQSVKRNDGFRAIHDAECPHGSLKSAFDRRSRNAEVARDMLHRSSLDH